MLQGSPTLPRTFLRESASGIPAIHRHSQNIPPSTELTTESPMLPLMRVMSLFALVTSLCVSQVALAENWPGWRGPRGDGTSAEAMPTEWDGASGKNIAWKTEIPGSGHGSPVIWEDRVFLISCLTDTEERALICLDRKSGKILWQQKVFTGPLETKHSLNSHASSTPATDGKLVYVSFLEVNGDTVPAPNVGRQRPVTPGQIVVAAYNMQGEQQWITKPGDFVSAHGFCSNPVLYKDMVILNGDHDGDSYLVALDKQTGKTLWKEPRRYKTRSYVTPLLREVNGQMQMVLSGSKCIVGVNPDNGERLWTIEGPTEQFVASMVCDGENFFMAAGFPTYHVMSIRADGQGDVTKSHVTWHSTEAKCYVPSPVLCDKYLLVADDRGTANCFDSKTGDRLWLERMGKHYSASLTTAGGLVYFLADDGIVKIVKPGPELEVVAENDLGEYSYASPAMSQGQIFIRGEKHLYCIGK